MNLETHLIVKEDQEDQVDEFIENWLWATSGLDASLKVYVENQENRDLITSDLCEVYHSAKDLDIGDCEFVHIHHLPCEFEKNISGLIKEMGPQYCIRYSHAEGPGSILSGGNVVFPTFSVGAVFAPKSLIEQVQKSVPLMGCRSKIFTTDHKYFQKNANKISISSVAGRFGHITMSDYHVGIGQPIPFSNLSSWLYCENVSALPHDYCKKDSGSYRNFEPQGKSEDPNNIVVVSKHRTGSTYLADLLSKHPDLHIFPFAATNESVYLPPKAANAPGGEDESFRPVPDGQVKNYLKDITGKEEPSFEEMQKYCLPNQMRIFKTFGGGKIHKPHLMEDDHAVWNIILNNKSFKIVYLHRPNLLERRISWTISMQHKIWTKENSEKKTIRLNPETILQEIEDDYKQLKNDQNQLSCIEYFFLETDKIDDQATRKKLGEFLGVDVSDLQSEIPVINPYPKNELVENWEEIVGVLEGTRHFWMTEEIVPKEETKEDIFELVAGK